MMVADTIGNIIYLTPKKIPSVFTPRNKLWFPPYLLIYFPTRQKICKSRNGIDLTTKWYHDERRTTNGIRWLINTIFSVKQFSAMLLHEIN